MNVHSTHVLDASVFSRIPKDGFSNSRLLVVGDLMLDRYVVGEVTRISPEAPVPVLAMRKERTVAGGAANVALNITGLRANVIVAGVIGRDAAAARLIEILSQNGISDDCIMEDLTRPTTSKTRVMCDNHQIVRIDSEATQDLSQEIAAELSTRIEALLDERVDAVLLSDYAKGVLTCQLTREIITGCLSRDIPVLVDPKRLDYTRYLGATLITPNQKEFETALGTMSIPLGNIGASGALLRNRLNCETLLVTQGAHGMTAITSDHFHHFPALAEEVFDVSGAGDTVIATVGTCLAAGLDVISAVQVANVAASLVVRRAGTVPVEWEDLYVTISQHCECATQETVARARVG